MQADPLPAATMSPPFTNGTIRRATRPAIWVKPIRMPSAALDENVLALIVLARLVEIGIDELAADIDDILDRPTDRRAIDVDIEHARENRDADHRLVAQLVRPGHFAAAAARSGSA